MAPIFLQGPKGSFIIFDYVVVVLAIFGNSLILESVLKVHFDLTGYRRFLISLAVSDLYICFVNVFSFVHSAIIMYQPDPELQKCGSDILRSMQFVGFFANLLNLCGMSVDHFIGIVYPLRYCDFMSPKIARMAVVSIWVVSCVIGFADYPISLGKYLASPSDPATAQAVAAERESDRLLEQVTSSLQTSSSMTSRFPSQPAFEIFGLDPTNASEPSVLPRTAEYYTFTPASSTYMTSYENSNGNNNINDTAAPSDLDLMSDDVNAILLSILGGSFPTDKYGINMNSSTKDRIKSIVNLFAEKKETSGWCTILHPSRGWLEFSVMTMTLICFVFLSICYGRIFKEVFGNAETGRNTRKLVVTTFLLLGAFTICWMPFMVFEFIMFITYITHASAASKATASSVSLFIAHNVFNSMLICSPLIDPLIYSVRMRIVRRYIIMRYKRFFPCCRQCLEKTSARRDTIAIGNFSAGNLSRNGINSSSRPTVLHSNKSSQDHTAAAKKIEVNDNHAPMIVVSDPATVKTKTISGFPAQPRTPMIYTAGQRFKRQMNELDRQRRGVIGAGLLATSIATSIGQGLRQGSALRNNGRRLSSEDDSTLMLKIKVDAIKQSSAQHLPCLGISLSDPPPTATSNGSICPAGNEQQEESSAPQLSEQLNTSTDEDDPLPDLLPGIEKINALDNNEEDAVCTLATPEHSDISTPSVTVGHYAIPGRGSLRLKAKNSNKSYGSPDEEEEEQLRLTDFVDSQAVYNKFCGNAFRLLDLNTTSGRRQDSWSENVIEKSSNLPRLGKSPSTGDFSSPTEDLLIVTTDC